MPQTEQEILDTVEPELHCSHEGIAHKQHEAPVIVDSDTVLRLYTMVVHLVDATAAVGTVWYPRKLKVVTLWALFSCSVIDCVQMFSGLEVFLSQQFRRSVIVRENVGHFNELMCKTIIYGVEGEDVQ